jgi:hypothetical protein
MATEEERTATIDENMRKLVKAVDELNAQWTHNRLVPVNQLASAESALKKIDRSVFSAR